VIVGYRELIKKVQVFSGFSDAESKEALEQTVKGVAERLNEGERKDFASQLPTELKLIALSAEASKEEAHRSILEEFMEAQDIPEDRAKKQVLSAWKALKQTVSEGEIRDIKSQLPEPTASLLY
jgi:uncharacterized protein (DUF2267 family)